MGLKDKAEGKAKEFEGKATGDKEREAEGVLEQAKGDLKDAAGHVKDAAGHAKDAAGNSPIAPARSSTRTARSARGPKSAAERRARSLACCGAAPRAPLRRRRAPYGAQGGLSFAQQGDRCAADARESTRHPGSRGAEQ